MTKPTLAVELVEHKFLADEERQKAELTVKCGEFCRLGNS